MTAFRPPLPRSAPARGRTRSRTRARTYARTVALAAVCCLAVPPATAAASSGDGGSQGRGHRSSGSAAAPAVTAGGPLLARPGVQVRPQARTPGLPSGVSALSWLVSDARTGQVLAAKNAHRRLPPASTLKTLFAVTVLPRFPGETTHKVTEAELAGIGAGSSMVGVVPGQTYTVADLWRGVFLSSGNDAVHVLAHMNGSVPRTVAQMQAKAEMLGAYDTHVVSPDGYDQPGQVSSAYDLALFARAGLADPDFAEYASTATARFPGGCDAHGRCVRSFGIQNTNRLLTGADGVTPYPGIVGVKNGYTTNAGSTLVAAARRGGRTLIATVMNPQSGVRQAAYREAAELLDWGFRAAGRTTSVGTLNAPPATFHRAPGRTAAVRPTASPSTPTSDKPTSDTPRPSTPRPSTPGPSAPASATPEPATARAASTSATAWYIGGALALAAAVSVLVLRRRGAPGKGG